jgi:hypothetical protein
VVLALTDVELHCDSVSSVTLVVVAYPATQVL